MKSDSERKRHYNAAKHRRRAALHAHLSKELMLKMGKKKRAILLHKGDKVLIMRGPWKGKTARVVKLNITKRKAFVEGITVRSARKKEMLKALEPSNLMLVELEPTEGRKSLFAAEAFRKEKQESKKQETEAEKAEQTQEQKAEKDTPSAAKEAESKLIASGSTNEKGG